MLLRNRPPGIDSRPAITSQGYEHLPHAAIAVLRWLNANHIDYVLVGPVARAIRGDAEAMGAVSIVPAPYGRNLDRLARALSSAHARPRSGEPQPTKLTGAQLIRPEAWTLRCGDHDLDIEGRPGGGAGEIGYQELLYEATRFDIAPQVSVEVAASEDIEHYDHLRRTGSSPEIRVSRAVREPHVN